MFLAFSQFGARNFLHIFHSSKHLKVMMHKKNDISKKCHVLNFCCGSLYLAFPEEKKCNSPVEDINAGGRVKVVGIPRGIGQKFRKKHGFPWGHYKKVENSKGITVNLTN